MEGGSLEKAVEILSSAKNVVVITGAGVSAESGVPTFRGEDGLWKNFRAEDLATPWAFRKDPELVWRWYDWRRGIIGKASPNPGHVAIKEMEDIFPEFLLITQNVDGLHRRAGSRSIIEIHGNLWRVYCVDCGKKGELLDVPLKDIPPRCDSCGGLLRPDVVWFGESLDMELLDLSYRALSSCDAVLVCGTSGVVQPVASFPSYAKTSGAKVVEVNLERTPISDVADVSLYGKSAEILPRIVEGIERFL